MEYKITVTRTNCVTCFSFAQKESMLQYVKCLIEDGIEFSYSLE